MNNKIVLIAKSGDNIKDLQKDTQSLQKEIFKANQEKENEEKQLQKVKENEEKQLQNEKENESTTRSVNETTKLINDNENIPENDKCIQTDETLDNFIMSILKDRRTWFVLIIVFTILHSLSGGSKKK
ncbi:hypothetical protein PIROE2DRAFT_14543 [Piromyces sp. E2]|nr:hypothetical protein PIROE2DRAFT_14543 [Piromyces sp. E2]|eukprot:OUM59842.1 hypothetical protein PIROE2DRAFT_14543 [Piromyces sp. E2]